MYYLLAVSNLEQIRFHLLPETSFTSMNDGIVL